jgi:hypothetical protein
VSPFHFPFLTPTRARHEFLTANEPRNVNNELTMRRREYAFTKAPKRMKSVVMAFSQLQTALASALNFALVSVNVEDKFEWLFASFAITAAIFAGLFYWT